MLAKGREQPTLAEPYAIYDQYVKPPQDERWGAFVAVSPAGETVLGRAAGDVSFRGRDAWGPGNDVIEVGPRVVGRGSSMSARRVEVERDDMAIGG